MTRKFKNTLSNYAGLALAVSGAMGGIGAAGVELPHGVTTACIVMATISGAVVAWLTGKKVQ